MPDPVRPSTFVSVVGWIVAIFSGFSVVIGVLQSAIVAVAFPMTAAMTETDASVPFVIRFLFEHFQLFVLLNLAVWALALAAAIALLKLKEWGRRVLVGLLSLAALMSVAMALAQQIMMSQMFPASQEMPADATSMMLIMRIGSALFALAFCGAFGFVALRLNSPRTRAEFQNIG
jgi:hypothetical protein